MTLDAAPAPRSDAGRSPDRGEPTADPGGPDRAAPPADGAAWAGPVDLAGVTAGMHVSAPLPRRGRVGSGSLLVVAMMLAAGGTAFAIGRSSAPAATTGGLAGAQSGTGPPASGAPGLAGGAGSMTISGTVVSLTGDQMTLKLASGQTVQVALSSSTAYHAQASATGTDVAAGASVTVRVAGGAGPAAPTSSGVPSSVAPAASAGASRTLTAEDVTITGQ